ncbi:hypothetical protein Tco_0869487, partial [Tanacetum coccineum]
MKCNFCLFSPIELHALLSQLRHSFDGANLYGARATGAAPRTKSIWNSTYRVGGNPGESFGKTSEKSRTVGTFSSRFSSD